MENAVKFLVKFCCSSFLSKRSSKVPRAFHDKFHAIFHEALCCCKCPISWRFSLCRRLSLTKALASWQFALQTTSTTPATQILAENLSPKKGCVFFWYRDVFLWYRGGRSLLFGIEISFLVSRFCILLFSIYIVLFLRSTCLCFFGPRHPVKWRSKKISIPKRRPKNLDT